MANFSSWPNHNYGQQVPQYQPQRGRYPSQGNRFPPTGNIVCVDSLEHALSMPTGYHSENVYFDNNQNVMYRVYTNELGEKSYLIFDILVHQAKPVENPQVTLDSLAERMTHVENILEVRNGKSNVSPNGGSTASTGPAEPAGQSNTQ